MRKARFWMGHAQRDLAELVACGLLGIIGREVILQARSNGRSQSAGWSITRTNRGRQ